MEWAAIGKAVLGVGKWFLVRPWAIAAVLLAGYYWHLHSDRADVRNQLALVQVESNMRAAEIAQLAANAATERGNAERAEESNRSMQLALDEAVAIGKQNLRLADAARRTAANALARLRSAEATIASMAEAETAERTAIYERDPECSTLRTMRVCPAMADRLRISAQANAPPG